MKSLKTVLNDIGMFFVHAMEANLGLSGQKWYYDGCATRYWEQATILNVFLIPFTLLFIGKTTLAFISLTLGALYSFVMVMFGLPFIYAYLEVSYPVEGLDEKEVEKIYGRKMKIVRSSVGSANEK